MFRGASGLIPLGTLHTAFGSVMGRGNYTVQGICQGTELWKIKGDVMVAGVTALILSQDSLSLF